MQDSLRAPVPELRIVPAEKLHAHESHDSQRSLPLIARFRSDEYIINPPIVAPLGDDSYVILDGANRCHALRALGYPHLPVQVVTWESGQIRLDTWNHVVSDWSADALLAGLSELSGLTMTEESLAPPVADLNLVDGRRFSLCAPAEDAHTRNDLLCRIVSVYQQGATLYRSVLNDQSQLQQLFPGMVALLRFPCVDASVIETAAREKAWIPPGVSRHIIGGRALRINYPVSHLSDNGRSLKQKNEDLQNWLRQKLAQRQLRFYAESTWQFDE